MSGIAELRKQKNMSQRQLAKELGISRTTLQGYEHGDRPPSGYCLQIMSQYFRVPIEEILGGCPNERG